MTLVSEYFAYARERHAIHLRRAAGQPPPWTEDPVLQRYRFCNVFRELDKTTVWFRENVRTPLQEKPEVLLATVLFRLFNRIATGEAIFCQEVLPIIGKGTAWKFFLGDGDTGYLKNSILSYCRQGPYVTGSFMVKTPTGMPKLDGVLWIVEQFATQMQPLPDDGGRTGWRGAAGQMLHFRDDKSWSLEEAWSWLRQFPFIGDFQAYEIVTDLRHTALLDRAPDIMTWANPGPGAKRGLKWLIPNIGNRGEQIGAMRELLAMSRDPEYWPQEGSRWLELARRAKDCPPGEWPAWEMRDVEHTLCEFDKYWRVQHGGSAPRGRMRYA